MYRFPLEKGSRKYICPDCSQKTFVRYVDNNTGDYVSDDVGRCDRESKCGYHFKPKMYFANNPQARVEAKNKRILNPYFNNKNGSQTKYEAQILRKRCDFIENKYLFDSLQNYEQNSFVQFLINLFPNFLDEIQIAVKDYFIGTTPDGKTCFWQIDKNMRIRTGKIIAYDSQTGKRIKSIEPNWIHTELKKYKKVRNDFNLKQCFFGEHLIRNNSNKNICIVEAEKTAVIASICFPEYIWLSIGAKQNLKPEKLNRLGREKKIILYPDADGFDEWNEVTKTARKNGFDVTISKLIKDNATSKELTDGFDLADYLILEQTCIGLN